ncbi:MAG: DNA-directed RNA polymerase subunit A' [archaeon]
MAQPIIKKRIGSIDFGLLSPQVIRKLSALEVTVSELYDQDGFPVEGGLMDPRMGIVDPGLRCRTCGSRVGECPGHFGYIELARPVIHIKFAEIIYRILASTCHNCGRARLDAKASAKYKKLYEQLDKEQTEMSKWKLVPEIYRLCARAKACPHCNQKNLPIKFEKPTTYYRDREKLTPIDIRDQLEKVPNSDLIFLGLDLKSARPEWMVTTALGVPPVTVRPSITLDSSERAEDDLTHKLVDIMRINLRLKENMGAGAPSVIIEDLWELLQYHATTFIDNEVASIPPARHRAGRVLKGIAQRIKSKEGRFRYNLAGKRVNFSARTVISPDSQISIEEVGIPYEVAQELTVPEMATDRNLEWLKKLILNGPNKKNGANYILLPDGRKKRITEDDKEQVAEELKPGMIVERHIVDGDIVLFNRQPSLHRLSIMAHRARVLPYHSFRLNPAVCPPYNADFDGDEMNLHVPQTLEASVEAEELMRVSKQIRSPRYGGPIVGGHQDHMTALYLLTLPETRLSREDANQILFEAGIDEEVEGPVTGKELFSKILPKDISMSFRSKACKFHGCRNCTPETCKPKTHVQIERGELKTGVIDESAIGSGEGKLLDYFTQKYGSEKVKRFIDNFTRLGLSFFRRTGFSVGIEDFEISASAKASVNQVLSEGEAESLKSIEDYAAAKLEALPGMTLRQTLELEIMGALNRARDKAVEIVRQYVQPTNPAIIMAICGARGKVLNVAQMAACLGQQAVGGGRVRRGYFERTLPHFKKGDIGAASKGFVKNSYGSGLDPFEFYWVAMAGREGLTDTSMRTPKSGYMYRRLSNALQDLFVDYDYSVRDSRGGIVQFMYGEDGLDPSKTDQGILSIKKTRSLAFAGSSGKAGKKKSGSGTKKGVGA